ncbi:hypothetical protein ACQJBY_012222 [Aegilops geniculata]
MLDNLIWISILQLQPRAVCGGGLRLFLCSNTILECPVFATILMCSPCNKASEKIKGTNKVSFASDVLFRRSGEVEKRIPRGSIHEWCGSNALG